MSYQPSNNLGTSVGLENLRRWRTALADLDNGGATKYNVVYQGDSISEGAQIAGGPAAQRDLCYPGRIRTALALRYDDVGTGMIGAHYPSELPFWTYTAAANWTVGGLGIAGKSRITTTASATAAMAFDGTGLTVILVKGPALGNCEVRIDGVIVGTIDAYNATQIGAARTDYTGLSAGAHAVSLRNVGTSTSGGAAGVGTHLVGVQPIKGTRGVILHNNSVYGTLAIDHASVTDRMMAEIDQFTPILTVINLTANDYTSQTPLATYISYMQTLITRAQQYGDVLMTSVGPNAAIGGYSITQSQYTNAMRSLALLNGAGYLDIYGRWRDGTYANTTLAFLNDGTHPNVKGHADMANAHTQVLLEPTTTIVRNVSTLRTVVAAANIVATDGVLRADATAGAFTLTLPSASDQSGRQFVIKKIDSTGNAVTVAAAGGQFIDGGATAVLSGQYITLTVVSDGSNWMVI